MVAADGPDQGSARRQQVAGTRDSVTPCMVVEQNDRTDRSQILRTGSLRVDVERRTLSEINPTAHRLRVSRGRCFRAPGSINNGIADAAWQPQQDAHSAKEAR